MDSSTQSQNRRSRRSQVLLAAELVHAGASCPVKLRNLSADGALVESVELPVEGAEVVFRRNELTAAGRVVWVNGQYAGIAFDEKLNPEQVLRHVPAPRQIIKPRYWRPGLTSSKLSEEQRKLAESWAWTPSAFARPGE